MIKNKILGLIIITLSIFIIISCEKDDGDTEAPTISIEGPINGDTLYVGTGVHFEANFEDNIQLRSYKIDIHDNFDGHSHKSINHEGTPWHFQKSWDFESDLKNAHIHHHEIVIPSEIEGKEIETGNYHFMVYCIDNAGNESWKAIEIKILESDNTDTLILNN